MFLASYKVQYKTIIWKFILNLYLKQVYIEN